MEDLIKSAVGMIKQSNFVVALTGAGISTESGIPDFRGPDGLWKRYDPMKVATIDAFMSDPSAYWQRALERKSLVEAKPNRGHLALAELERIGKLKAVITQNVDGLHQKAGCSYVIELHGSAYTAHCLNCGRKYLRVDILKRVEEGELPPTCECGGIIKPDVILFGEPLPKDALEGAMQQSSMCDLMLVLGTSLTVYPAAHMPDIAKQNGAKIIIVNMEPTERDFLGDIVILGRTGEILPKIVEKVKEMRE
jgi:NAD-dependent deacetylase